MSQNDLITIIGFGAFALLLGIFLAKGFGPDRSSTSSTQASDETALIATAMRSLFSFDLRTNNGELPIQIAQSQWFVGFTWSIGTRLANQMELSNKLSDNAKWELMKASYVLAFGLPSEFVNSSIIQSVKIRESEFIEGYVDGEKYSEVIEVGDNDAISEVMAVLIKKKSLKVSSSKSDS